MTPLLQVENIAKFYGARIGCTDVSFDLYPGEVMGIDRDFGRAFAKSQLGAGVAALQVGDEPWHLTVLELHVHVSELARLSQARERHSEQ